MTTPSLHRATALTVERHAGPGCNPTHRHGYAIVDGPFAGVTFIASDRVSEIGVECVVSFHPEDQYARRADTDRPAHAAGQVTSATAIALAALRDHERQFAGQLLTRGTFASEEFDRLYESWIRTRWDAGDLWVRGVWTSRP